MLFKFYRTAIVRYISVNKSNYQWESARLMKTISIINNINSLAHSDIIY